MHWLPDSSYTVSDLLVNCLGGPLIDTRDDDWILSPEPDVWQPTPSLLITSFTPTTGLLGPRAPIEHFLSESLLHSCQLLTPLSLCVTQQIQLLLYTPYLHINFLLWFFWVTGDWRCVLLTIWVNLIARSVEVLTKFLIAVWLIFQSYLGNVKDILFCNVCLGCNYSKFKMAPRSGGVQIPSTGFTFTLNLKP